MPGRDYPELALHIAGRWRTQAGGGTRAVVDPATEETIAQLPLAGREELAEAAEAARRGFVQWRAKSTAIGSTRVR